MSLVHCLNRLYKNPYIVNTAWSFIKAFALLATVSWANHILPLVMLGIIMAFRRYTATLAAFFQVGLTQGMGRFIINETEKQAQHFVLWRFLCAGLIMCGAVLGLSFLASSWVSDYCFGQDAPDEYGFYLGILVTGFLFNTYISALAKQYMVFSRAAVWDIICTTFPFTLVVGLYLSAIITDEPTLMAIMVGATAVLGFINFLLIPSFVGAKFSDIVKWAKTGSYLPTISEFRYGFWRGFTFFLDNFMTIWPIYLLQDNKEDIAYFNLAAIIIRIAQMVVIPLGQVAGLSLAWARDSYHDEHQKIKKLVMRVFLGSLILMVVYQFTKEPLIALLFPNGTAEILFFSNIMVLTLPMVVLSSSMRTYTDLNFKKPYNMMIFLLSAVLFASVYMGTTYLEFTNKQAVVYGFVSMYLAYLAYLPLVFIKPDGYKLPLKLKNHQERMQDSNPMTLLIENERVK